MRWALSVLDWRWHAIDDLGDHPAGVFRAQCGHLAEMEDEEMP